MKIKGKDIFLSVLVLLAFLLVFFIPPIPQDLEYHYFADSRVIFGIYNFWNVLSILPFLLVGGLGLVYCRGGKLSPNQKLPLGIFSLGILLISGINNIGRN